MYYSQGDTSSESELTTLNNIQGCGSHAPSMNQKIRTSDYCTESYSYYQVQAENMMV